VIKSSLKLSLS